MGFLQSVSKYQLSRLIEIGSELSRKLWATNEPVATLYRMDSSRFIRGAFKKAGDTYLLPWFIVDVVYHAIARSSDFAYFVPSEHDFLNLYNEYLRYDEELSESLYTAYSAEDKLFYILFGLIQKTFWFQEKNRLLSMNVRFYHMLYEIPKMRSNSPQPYKHIETKYKCDFQAYNVASIALVWVASHSTKIAFPYQLAPSAKRKGVDNRLIEAILGNYLSNYTDVRNSTLRARQLYLTPVVRSSQNELLITSAFLMARKAFTNLYWETREVCLYTDGIELNLQLGVEFETYVDILLEHHLKKDKYRRLERLERTKRADLVVLTTEYTVIIEQKFAMLNISQQDTHFDLEKVDRWLRAYVQATKQLELTAQEFLSRRKPIVKLILFFDNLYLADGLVRERVVRFSVATGDVQPSLVDVFMISIDEFERLIQLIGSNEEFANRVLEEKIKRQDLRDIEKGIEFDQIMNEMSAPRNEYIKEINPISRNVRRNQ